LADEASVIRERGDRAALADFSARVQRVLGRESGAVHLFVDEQGRDLLSGVDHSALLKAAQSTRRPTLVGPNMVVAVPAQRGGVYYLIRRPPPSFDTLAQQLPYFLLFLATLALFCWLLAVDIAAPLGRMAAGVRRFGAGELDARLGVRRKDEIGQLSHAFDEMAGRIEALVRSERQLLQDVSHELRSPLARLGVSVQLARRPDQRDVALAQMERELERLGELVGDLVTVTKAEGSATQTSRRPVRLDVLAQDVLETCQVEASGRGSSITWANLAGEVELVANTELLWRLLENVIRNAIYYGPPNSVVDVKLVSAAANSAEITVRDHGPGVAPDDLAKLFRPFYRTDPSRTADTGGLGLGLSIAQRAVLLHHGTIEAENASPGLRVRIRLPLSVQNS
jgi:two-component system sensor histidine kinase CpxA